MNQEIVEYNSLIDEKYKDICELLLHLITKNLVGSDSKVWHGAPVWFIDGNPIVGYAVRKNNVQLLFWSGQSFDERGLSPEGTFKAAEAKYTDIEQINEDDIQKWLKKSVDIQWDYKNIVKKRGQLDRLK